MVAFKEDVGRNYQNLEQDSQGNYSRQASLHAHISNRI